MRAAAALLLGLVACALAAEEELLPADEAFRLRTWTEDAALVAHWDIAPGYYLYRERFRVEAIGGVLRLKAPAFPPGVVKQDPFFGRTEIYTRHVTLRVPYERRSNEPTGRVRIAAQGCNEPLGVCYPPITKELAVDLGPAGGAGESPLEAPVPRRGILGDESIGPIDPNEAFRLEVVGLDAGTLGVRFTVGDCCYLYRDKFRFALAPLNSSAAKARRPTKVALPPGERIIDEFFGPTEVYRRGVDLTLAVPDSAPSGPLRLEITYQGCAEKPVAICYEPVTRRFSLVSGAKGLRAQSLSSAP